MLKLLLCLLPALCALTATAATITADLNLCNSALCAVDGIDPGTVVARVVAADVAGGIDFTITTQNSGWLLWDGGFFGFNAPAGGLLVLPAGYSSAGSGNEDGFGAFQYRINGPTKGGLAQNGATVFTFGVIGLRTSQIEANAGGHRFAAHIGVPEGACGGEPCAGVTGFVTDEAAQAPEPRSLALMGTVLIGLGCSLRRRRRA
jgi:hypothetical protein